MRLATFNVENLFVRARALDLEGWTEGRKILGHYAVLWCDLDVYSDRRT